MMALLVETPKTPPNKVGTCEVGLGGTERHPTEFINCDSLTAAIPPACRILREPPSRSAHPTQLSRLSSPSSATARRCLESIAAPTQHNWPVPEDATTRVWDTSTGAVLGGAAWSRNLRSTQSAAVGEDGTPRVWDTATHKNTTTLTSDVSAFAYHPDGTRVAITTGSAVHLRDITTGELTLTLIRHTNIVVSAAFSPDGARLDTASDHHTARIWNSNSGEAMHIFGGLDA